MRDLAKAFPGDQSYLLRLTRTRPPPSSAAVFARATADFVLHMKWRKILIFYAEDEEPTLLGQHCQDAGVIVTRQLFNPGSQDSMTRALKVGGIHAPLLAIPSALKRL